MRLALHSEGIGICLRQRFEFGSLRRRVAPVQKGRQMVTERNLQIVLNVLTGAERR